MAPQPQKMLVLAFTVVRNKLFFLISVPDFNFPNEHTKMLTGKELALWPDMSHRLLVDVYLFAFLTVARDRSKFQIHTRAILAPERFSSSLHLKKA
jgi:hypothetical protein